MNRRNFFSRLAAAGAPAAGLALAAGKTASADVIKAVGAGRKNIPNVPVTSHDGKKYNFYTDLVKGKLVLINMFYAECVGICPRMTSNLLKIQKALNDQTHRLGKDIFIYSISLKPEQDNPKKLAEYAQMHGIKPGSGWFLLNAHRQNMELLRERLGFKDSDPVLDADINQHTGMLRFGSDVWDIWSAYPLLGRVETIVPTILSTDLSLPRRGFGS